DVWRVRELVNKSPDRNMHKPGAGVGGHCIPKDPWLLAHAAEGSVPLRLIPAARMVNDAMPQHMVQLLVAGLGEHGRALAQARVAVLGYAYLEESDDARNSPSETLVNHLRALGADVTIHDPFVGVYQGDVLACVRDCDAVIVMVAHRAYRALDLAQLQSALRSPVLIDGRHLFDACRARDVGLTYRGVGEGKRISGG
ncbi:MAG: nucleotide sugar dehydrogenase, partial [Chloroflexi bacterium]|nr:nucleotide sugar dehydrogenase [Chloroflexota bacterium]